MGDETTVDRNDPELKYLTVEKNQFNDPATQAEWTQKRLVWVPHETQVSLQWKVFFYLILSECWKWNLCNSFDATIKAFHRVFGKDSWRLTKTGEISNVPREYSTLYVCYNQTVKRNTIFFLGMAIIIPAARLFDRHERASLPSCNVCHAHFLTLSLSLLLSHKQSFSSHLEAPQRQRMFIYTQYYFWPHQIGTSLPVLFWEQPTERASVTGFIMIIVN